MYHSHQTVAEIRGVAIEQSVGHGKRQGVGVGVPIVIDPSADSTPASAINDALKNQHRIQTDT